MMIHLNDFDPNSPDVEKFTDESGELTRTGVICLTKLVNDAHMEFTYNMTETMSEVGLVDWVRRARLMRDLQAEIFKLGTYLAGIVSFDFVLLLSQLRTSLGGLEAAVAKEFTNATSVIAREHLEDLDLPSALRTCFTMT